MAEPLSVADLLQIIGDKETQLYVERQRVEKSRVIIDLQTKRIAALETALAIDIETRKQ